MNRLEQPFLAVPRNFMKPAPESPSAFEMFLACTHLGFITLAICGNASQLAAQVLPISARSCYDQRRESMMVKSQSQRFVSSSYRRVHPLLSAIFAFYCVLPLASFPLVLELLIARWSFDVLACRIHSLVMSFQIAATSWALLIVAISIRLQFLEGNDTLSEKCRKKSIVSAYFLPLVLPLPLLFLIDSEDVISIVDDTTCTLSLEQHLHIRMLRFLFYWLFPLFITLFICARFEKFIRVVYSLMIALFIHYSCTFCYFIFPVWKDLAIINGLYRVFYALPHLSMFILWIPLGLIAHDFAIKDSYIAQMKETGTFDTFL